MACTTVTARAEEMMTDISYLRRNHRRQEPQLIKLDVDGVEPISGSQLEVRTTRNNFV